VCKHIWFGNLTDYRFVSSFCRVRIPANAFPCVVVVKREDARGLVAKRPARNQLSDDLSTSFTALGTQRASSPTQQSRQL
jgi:hypothetical protein